jgi:hypothetical protein
VCEREREREMRTCLLALVFLGSDRPFREKNVIDLPTWTLDERERERDREREREGERERERDN